MAEDSKYHVFYDMGVQWALDNFVSLRSLETDREALDKRVRDAFNREGFIETVFRTVRIYNLCMQNPVFAESKFVAGVCDTVYRN